MRISLLLTVLCLLSLVIVCVYGLPDQVTHVDAMEQHELDLDIQQPSGAPSRTPRASSTRRSPRTDVMIPRHVDLIFVRRDPIRFHMNLDTDADMFQLTPFERRMLVRMFRHMFRLRMREIMGFPMPQQRMRMIRMMALRDMMMAMDVQPRDAAQVARKIVQREVDMDEAEAEAYDDTTETDTETETEAEPNTETENETIADDNVVEHDIDDPRLIDSTLMETEFETLQFGGFGFGFGKKGKGFNFNFGKKAPFKKIPKKLPPKKKGFI